MVRVRSARYMVLSMIAFMMIFFAPGMGETTAMDSYGEPPKKAPKILRHVLEESKVAFLLPEDWTPRDASGIPFEKGALVHPFEDMTIFYGEADPEVDLWKVRNEYLGTTNDKPSILFPGHRMTGTKEYEQKGLKIGAIYGDGQMAWLKPNGDFIKPVKAYADFYVIRNVKATKAGLDPKIAYFIVCGVYPIFDHFKIDLDLFLDSLGSSY